MAMRNLILASKSPRRCDLLKNHGFKFQVLPLEISEILNKNLSLDDAVMDLAYQKGQALLSSGKLLNIENYLVLSGDTIVVVGDEVLGKPKNTEIAVEYLKKLSGITHSVKTSICLLDQLSGEVVKAIETSKITFRKLSDEEINEYVATGDPMDKAGAYGIQTLKKGYITDIDGSVENVMGLPVKLFERILLEKGWNVDRE